MSYRDTARAFARAERDPRDTGAAAALPVSEWSEARRDLLTPQTIAANHVLHVSDAANVLRSTVATIRERGMWAGELVTWEEAARLLADRAAALLAAIGEAEDA